MRLRLTSTHEVDIGHVPLAPTAPPDAVHVRPRAQLILVVFASLVVTMYCCHSFASILHTEKPRRVCVEALLLYV